MLAPCQIVSAIGAWNDLGARQNWPCSIPNRVDLPQKILPLSGPTQLAMTSVTRDSQIPRKRFISKLADSSAGQRIREMYSPPETPSRQERSGPEGFLRSTNESIITNIREEKKGPRRGHSRTFYPRAARSRSPFRPTSQVEHHPITLLRLAVKLICPDCVSAPTKAIRDRGPGIARPSAPSACPTDRPTNSTQPHEPRTCVSH
ncbi:hypothetical protein F5888DRAFT_1657473, partial [Russula emetica]